MANVCLCSVLSQQIICAAVVGHIKAEVSVLWRALKEVRDEVHQKVGIVRITTEGRAPLPREMISTLLHNLRICPDLQQELQVHSQRDLLFCHVLPVTRLLVTIYFGLASLLGLSLTYALRKRAIPHVRIIRREQNLGSYARQLYTHEKRACRSCPGRYVGCVKL